MSIPLSPFSSSHSPPATIVFLFTQHFSRPTFHSARLVDPYSSIRFSASTFDTTKLTASDNMDRAFQVDPRARFAPPHRNYQSFSFSILRPVQWPRL